MQELLKQKQAYYQYFTEEESLEAVKRIGWDLKYVHTQTEEICLEAVRRNERALAYVNENLFIEKQEIYNAIELLESKGYEINKKIT